MIFYNHKILSTLFPENFARVYVAAGKTKEVESSISYTIRERMFGDYPKSKNIGDFEDVIKSLAEMGIPIKFDTARRNFIVGIDGRTIYIDMVDFAGWTADYEKPILDWMEQRQMSEQDKDLVKRSLHRLLELGQSAK